MKTVIIIGASHAAAEAIATLRKKGWTERIVLIGDETEIPYHRPPLSKAYMQDEIGFDKLQIRKPEFYADNNVDLFLGRRAESIDRKAQHVVLDNGETVAYEHLILATGTRARYLPVEGGDLPSIHYLRTKQEVDAIKASVKPGSKLLIVGAGYIGLEVAASAVKQGVDVVVLEAADRVLARVTSPAVSEFYQTVHKDAGVDIRLGVGLDHFEQAGGEYKALLADGEALSFDTAIVGIGVIPNVELAESAGLACDNGIVVDEFTQTDDPNIYAVGDCSNHPSFIYDRRIRLESVPNANGQAKTAALAICGERVPYNQLPWFWSDQYDIKLQTAGLLQDYDSALVRGSPTDKKFSVFYLRDGQLIACDSINAPADFMNAKKMVLAEAKPDPIKVADSEVPLKDCV